MGETDNLSPDLVNIITQYLEVTGEPELTAGLGGFTPAQKEFLLNETPGLLACPNAKDLVRLGLFLAQTDDSRNTPPVYGPKPPPPETITMLLGDPARIYQDDPSTITALTTILPSYAHLLNVPIIQVFMDHWETLPHIMWHLDTAHPLLVLTIARHAPEVLDMDGAYHALENYVRHASTEQQHDYGTWWDSETHANLLLLLGLFNQAYDLDCEEPPPGLWVKAAGRILNTLWGRVLFTHISQGAEGFVGDYLGELSSLERLAWCQNARNNTSGKIEWFFWALFAGWFRLTPDTDTRTVGEVALLFVETARRACANSAGWAPFLELIVSVEDPYTLTSSPQVTRTILDSTVGEPRPLT